MKRCLIIFSALVCFVGPLALPSLAGARLILMGYEHLPKEGDSVDLEGCETAQKVDDGYLIGIGERWQQVGVSSSRLIFYRTKARFIDGQQLDGRPAIYEGKDYSYVDTEGARRTVAEVRDPADVPTRPNRKIKD